MLLLEGDAGIGKTSLLEYGRNGATQRGHHVLSATPVETEMPLAYAGLADLLETIPPALIDSLPMPQRHAVRHAVLRLEPSVDPVDPQTTSMAVRALFRRLADTSPVVLAVDDLQWLDPPSARVLSFVLRRMQREPLGLLAAARTSWPEDQPLLTVHGLPSDRLDRVRVGPLSLGAIREVIDIHLGMSPGRSLLVRLHEVSGGNPLFALELAGRTYSGVPQELFGLQEVPGSLRRLVAGSLPCRLGRARSCWSVRLPATRRCLSSALPRVGVLQHKPISKRGSGQASSQLLRARLLSFILSFGR